MRRDETLLPKDLVESAIALVSLMKKHHVMIATAESCTGGLIAAALTEVAGSSAVVDRGYVTYSNEAKVEMLGVDPAVIAAKGAVSEEVARQMAEGALSRSRAAITIAVTGVAGPGGGSAEKPVGLVHMAAAIKGGETHHERHKFPGGRGDVRGLTVAMAFSLVEALLLNRYET